jgi:hypothetical protein
MKTKKILIAAICFIFLSIGAFAQEEEGELKEPLPIKDLPKESKVKCTFEFDKLESYKLYDSEGTLLEKGKGQMVDMSDLPKGTYYISYSDTKAVYKKK